MRNRNLSVTRFSGSSPFNSDVDNGLTKREAAAIAAMQGLLSNGPAYAAMRDQSDNSRHLLAFMAVRQADALFDELDEDEEDGS